MRRELVIFDLDGTLLNTLDDLADSANLALSEAGFPTHSREDIRRYIGNGVARLLRRAAPEGTDEQTIDNMIKRFKVIYMEHLNVHTRPFPGVIELLDRLNAAGIKTAVNSNKIDAASQSLCRHHFGNRLDMVLGERDGIPRKPAPDGAKLIMETLGVDPENTLYVGDGDADLLTAKNAGIDSAWVSWGFRKREELEGIEIPHAFDTIDELSEYILKEERSL